MSFHSYVQSWKDPQEPVSAVSYQQWVVAPAFHYEWDMHSATDLAATSQACIQLEQDIWCIANLYMENPPPLLMKSFWQNWTCIVSSTSDGSMVTNTAEAIGKASWQAYQVYASKMLGLKLRWSNLPRFEMHSKPSMIGPLASASCLETSDTRFFTVINNLWHQSLMAFAVLETINVLTSKCSYHCQHVVWLSTCGLIRLNRFRPISARFGAQLLPSAWQEQKLLLWVAYYWCCIPDVLNYWAF